MYEFSSLEEPQVTLSSFIYHPSTPSSLKLINYQAVYANCIPSIKKKTEFDA
jgi:hypothetical protein